MISLVYILSRLIIKYYRVFYLLTWYQSLEKHNYTSWCSFLKIHLGSLGLKTHIEGSSTNSNDPEWDKQDDLVKVWILGTLEESLQDQVVATPGNAKALWDHIKNLFHDNKDARAITLDGELRSIKLGSLTINAYCTKIKAIADRLANLGEKVSDKNLVMYALNRLDTWYKGIARLIRHIQPLPKFETARNMLLLEESNLQEAIDQANTYDGSSSSPTVLMATKTDTKVLEISIPSPNRQQSLLISSPQAPLRRTNALVIPARLVANGSGEQLGIDCDETFNPVVKPTTIRTVLSLAVSPSSTYLLQQVVTSLHNEFNMTDLGALNYFLGISATRHSTRLFLSQKQYAIELLARAHMTNCNSSRTPIDTDSKLGPEGVPLQGPTLYRSLAGGLQYLTFTRPDISYAVQQICLFMHDPHEPHLAALKRILRYIRGTLDFGFHLYSSTTISLVGYTHTDWAGCPSTRRSTSGYCVFLGDNLMSWSSKRQQSISRSSVEAEYQGVVNVVAKTAWLRNLLREQHSPLFAATLVNCDNVSAIYLSANPVQHQQTKHIEIDIHLVRNLVTAGQVRVLHVPSRYQYTDIFTKGLPSALFEDFRSSLSVRLPSAPTAREY
nr:ribonuclease H-like domain-containing protein [Tanacetum cinerariifolium]